MELAATLVCRECSSEFTCTPTWRKQHGRWCRKCYALYQRRYREAHPENYKLHLVAWRAANPSKVKADRAKHRRGKLEKYLDLKSRPCVDCGETYPHYVMQFDHVRPGKLACVSELLLGRYETLLDEVAKCELVCANCHAERTYQRARTKQQNALSKLPSPRCTASDI